MNESEYAKYYLENIAERYRGFESKASQILGFIVIATTIVATFLQVTTLSILVKSLAVSAAVLLLVSAIFCVFILFPGKLFYPGPLLDEIRPAFRDLSQEQIDEKISAWLIESAKKNEPLVAQKSKLFVAVSLATLLGVVLLVLSAIVLLAQTIK